MFASDGHRFFFFGWSMYSCSVQAIFSKCIVSLTQERSSEKLEIFHRVVGGERSPYPLQLLGSVMNGPNEVLALSLQCQSCGRLLFFGHSDVVQCEWRLSDRVVLFDLALPQTFDISCFFVGSTLSDQRVCSCFSAKLSKFHLQVGWFLSGSALL